MSRCEAAAPRGGLCARLALVSTVLLGLLAMHAGLAAHALASSPCVDRTCHDTHPASLHVDEAGAEHDGHRGAICSAVFRDDPELVSHPDRAHGPTETPGPVGVLAVGRARGDKPARPPPQHANDLSVYCVWRL